jgi:hypothetical protein
MDKILPNLNRIFALPDRMVSALRAKHSALLEAHPMDQTVVMHIRRVDYLNHPEVHGILDEDYYEGALKRIQAMMPGTTVKVLVFSDDKDWSRQRPWLSDAHVVDEDCDASALWLMSQFSNYVVSNSSFSWWAVMLGTKYERVIAPDCWFGPKGHQDYEDIYQDDWILLPVKGCILTVKTRTN